MVNLSKIVTGLKMVTKENDVYYNPENDEIILSNIGMNSELNEDEIDGLFEQSIILPTSYEINEYEIVQKFIETIDDEVIHDKLASSIIGKGAFRRMKDVCIEFHIIEKWYKFRDNSYKDIAIKWCKSNGIEFIDDIHI